MNGGAGDITYVMVFAMLKSKGWTSFTYVMSPASQVTKSLGFHATLKKPPTIYPDIEKLNISSNNNNNKKDNNYYDYDS